MIIKSVTKKSRSGKWWVFAGLILVAAASYIAIAHWVLPRISAPPAGNQSVISGHLQEPELANLNANSGEEEAPLPESKLLPVPFTPQAPTGNWDELHNEACEEASALMADAYFSGRREAALTAEYAESEIAKLTEWQKQNFGYYLDITTAEMAVMVTKVYGLKAKVIPFPSADKIKHQLVAGNIVVFSANGQKLGNPNYKQPGPIHHMLLVKGYDKNSFITNDSGTRKGLNYSYNYATLKDSAADWDHNKKTVDETKKLAIIISQ